jgi:urease accessory protein
MTARSSLPGLITAAAIMLMPAVASAHVGAGGTSGLAHGFWHPLGGLDHMLAMVAVGMFAANLGGRALWAVPLTFVAMMAAGGALGIQAVELPFVEAGIALSVVVLGLVVALRLQWPVAAAMALVGGFAIFHGYAHGSEMAPGSSGAAYAAGFMAATALLHLAGIALGLGLQRVGSLYWARTAQFGGSAMALAGVALLAGAL